jgi:hypothetical protein
MATITDSFTWIVMPTGALGVPGPKMPYAATVTEVSSYVTAATSATFNIEERSSIGSAGTNVLSSDQVADTNGESITSSFGNSGLASGCYLWLDVASVSGTPGTLQVTIAFTYEV